MCIRDSADLIAAALKLPHCDTDHNPLDHPGDSGDALKVKMCIRDRSAAAPGSTAPSKKEKPAQPVQPKREVVTVRVDTRSGDVNLDKFNEKYESMRCV